MGQNNDKSGHKKKIIMHLKRHHRKYLFGAIGGFALVKMVLLFFGLSPVLNIRNIFADENIPILRLTNIDTLCTPTLNRNTTGEYDTISCTGKNIGAIEPGIFSGLTIGTLDLSYNKLSTIDFEVFTGVSGLTTLNLTYNQIYDTEHDTFFSSNNLSTSLQLNNNCLSSGEIGSSYDIGQQDVCFYIEYSPASLTSGDVYVEIVFTGDTSKIDKPISGNVENNIVTLDGNDSIVFNVHKYYGDSGYIRNYPEGCNSDSCQFLGNVDWIDKDGPSCGSMRVPSVTANDNGWINQTGTYKLKNPSDNDGAAGLYLENRECTLEEKENSTCIVTIRDNAGNSTDCQSPSTPPVNIDTHAPTITLSQQSGDTASSHNVTVSIKDNISGLDGGQRLYYRRQTGDSCSNDTGLYYSTSQYSAGATGVTSDVSTIVDDLLNGKYYLCILGGITDLAGNASEGLRSEGVFVLENEDNRLPEDLIVTGGLIGFSGNTIPSSWVADDIDVEFIVYSGSNGTYGYYSQDISSDNKSGLDYQIPSDGIIHINVTNFNGLHICAFAQTGKYIQTICSDNTIQIDRYEPSLNLSIVNGAEVGDNLILSWDGSDEQSGISEYILTLHRPDNTIITKRFSPDTMSTGVTVDQIGTRTWSVAAIDGVGKTTLKSSSFVVTNSATPPTPPTPEIQTGVLIQFESQPYNGWTNNIEIKFQLTGGATGEWGFANTNNTGVFNCSMGCNPIPSTPTIQFSGMLDGQYICATAYKEGYNPRTICSDSKVFVDPISPQIEPQGPNNGSHFEYGDTVTFRWSGHDEGPAGVSGYILTITDPDNANYGTYSFNSGTIHTGIIVKKSGTWTRNIKIVDNAGNTAEQSRYFYVHKNGDTETGFYLISPALFDEIELGTNVTFTWNTGAGNSGYKWSVEKLGGDIISGGTTDNNYIVLNSGYFSRGAYSRSVRDIGAKVTKSIPLFYVIKSGDNLELKVNQFEFDEIEDAELNEYYTSNKITIKGLEDGWYNFAYLKDGIGALYINGDFVGTEGVVKNGDKIRIELKADSGYNSTTVAKLIVGNGDNLVSGDFKVTTQNGITGRDDGSLTTFQKLWGVIYINSLVEMYQNDEEKLAIFLSTFMQLLQDKSDYYAQAIAEAETDGDDELVAKYKTYKNAIDFLYTLVKDRYDNIELENRTIYIAPNGKQYVVEYNEERRAYTSPDFVKPKYFPSRALFTNHIDMNNPAKGKWGIVGNVITTHNGKVYTIYETNGKWTSSNFRTAKYFDTKEDIINHILANNPASNWNHTIDTDFGEVEYKAPNGKIYKIFKTSSKGNNPEMYSSYNFVNAKYFTSLEAAKKFIDQNNPKK